MPKCNDYVSQFSKDRPYVLRWRFDFDPSLHSVCRINGGKYDPENLSDDDMAKIEEEFGEYKDIKTFCQAWLEKERIEDLKDFLADGFAWIDYVCVGIPNKTHAKYHGCEYWELPDGHRSSNCCEYDEEFSSDGCFQFCDDGLPLCTRVFVDGKCTFDYRTGEF